MVVVTQLATPQAEHGADLADMPTEDVRVELLERGANNDSDDCLDDHNVPLQCRKRLRGGGGGSTTGEEARNSGAAGEAERRAEVNEGTVQTEATTAGFWRPMLQRRLSQRNVITSRTLGLNHLDPFLRPRAWEHMVVPPGRWQPVRTSVMYVEPLEPLGALQWTSAVAVVTAEFDLHSSLVPLTPPRLTVSVLQQRLEALMTRVHTAAGWRGCWLGVANWTPAHGDAARSLGLWRRVDGHWRRWAVVGSSANMARSGATGLGVYSWRSGPATSREWRMASFDGAALSTLEAEADAISAASAAAAAGNAYMMVFPRVRNERWVPGGRRGRAEAEAHGAVAEAVAQGAEYDGVVAIVLSPEVAVGVLAGAWVMAHGAVWRPAVVWDAVDGSVGGPPFLHEACDHRLPSGAWREP